MSFVLDSRLLVSDGANFCPYASGHIEEEELEKGELSSFDESQRKSKEFIAEKAERVTDEDDDANGDSAGRDSVDEESDLEIEIEPNSNKPNEPNDNDEPQSPYRPPGSPLGGISRWLRSSPKASTDELTDVKLDE